MPRSITRLVADTVAITVLASCGGGGGGASAPSTTASSSTAPSYTLGGTVSGLSGTGLVLSDSGGDHLPVTANGSFVFATKLALGAQYSVTVSAQPNGPAQMCVVSRGSGMVSGDVSKVEVVCTTNTYTVGGTVSGLSGLGLVLSDNGADNLPVTASGSFAFPTKLASGAQYSVTVSAQPNAPAQTCVVSQAGGTVGSANISSVSVGCTTLPSVSGTYRLTAIDGSGESGSVGTLSFDASGNISGSELLNNAGTVSTRAITETYSLTADGTLTITPVGGTALTGARSNDGATFVAAADVSPGQSRSRRGGYPPGVGAFHQRAAQRQV